MPCPGQTLLAALRGYVIQALVTRFTPHAHMDLLWFPQDSMTFSITHIAAVHLTRHPRLSGCWDARVMSLLSG